MDRTGSRWSRRQLVQGAGIVGLGLVTGCGRLPWQARESKLHRIGYLGVHDIPTFTAAFQHGLREHGYVEGQNLAIEWRFAEDRAERLPDLTAELLARQVDVIVVGTNPAALVAGHATSTTPIVMANGDPVGTGLAASLARPGGNVTGVANVSPQLGAKRLELLRDTIPDLARVAVLWPPYNPVKVAEWTATQRGGAALGLQLQSLEVGGSDDFERAFAAAIREQAGALIVFGDNLTSAHAPQIGDLAARSELPTMYEAKTFMAAGGLMSYEPDLAALHRRAAYYVDKILKGAKSADVPIEQPMRFDFAINLRTAQALGLTIPQHVLLQATEVIQ
jgi:putative tryptophan/tyrosine transport system substrate-binding protein